LRPLWLRPDAYSPLIAWPTLHAPERTTQYSTAMRKRSRRGHALMTVVWRALLLPSCSQHYSFTPPLRVELTITLHEQKQVWGKGEGSVHPHGETTPRGGQHHLALRVGGGGIHLYHQYVLRAIRPGTRQVCVRCHLVLDPVLAAPPAAKRPKVGRGLRKQTKLGEANQVRRGLGHNSRFKAHAVFLDRRCGVMRQTQLGEHDLGSWLG